MPTSVPAPISAAPDKLAPFAITTETAFAPASGILRPCPEHAHAVRVRGDAGRFDRVVSDHKRGGVNGRRGRAGLPLDHRQHDVAGLDAGQYDRVSRHDTSRPANRIRKG